MIDSILRNQACMLVLKIEWLCFQVSSKTRVDPQAKTTIGRNVKKVRRPENNDHGTGGIDSKISAAARWCHNYGLSHNHLVAHYPTKSRRMKCFKYRGYGYVSSACLTRSGEDKSSCPGTRE